MWKKRQEKALEQMIKKLYAGVELGKNEKDPITRETLDQILKNIAKELVGVQSSANQALY